MYLDSSLIVALLTPEPASERAHCWVIAQPPRTLAISDWVSAEVASALSLKIRTGSITVEGRALAMAAYARFVASMITIPPIKAAHFIAAARFCAHHALALRAPDALHLAIAADRGDTLATLDIAQAEAGRELGIATLLI